MNTQDNIIHHTLVFHITNMEEELAWTVSAEMAAQVTSMLNDMERGERSNPMLELITIDNRILLINLDHVVLVQSLVDYGVPIQKEAPNAEDSDEDEEVIPDGELMIEGFPDPVRFVDVTYSDLCNLAASLTDDFDAVFISFIDDDGEYNYVKRDRVIYMEYEHRDEEMQEENSDTEPE